MALMELESSLLVTLLCREFLILVNFDHFYLIWQKMSTLRDWWKDILVPNPWCLKIKGVIWGAAGSAHIGKNFCQIQLNSLLAVPRASSKGKLGDVAALSHMINLSFTFCVSLCVCCMSCPELHWWIMMLCSKDRLLRHCGIGLSENRKSGCRVCSGAS